MEEPGRMDDKTAREISDRKGDGYLLGMSRRGWVNRMGVERPLWV
jgi:hypothetical protein